MKTIKFSLLLGVLLIASLTSCTKDDPQNGDFNPGKKIQKIFISYDINDDPFLCEEWHWRGNKLESIDHYVNVNGETILACKEEFSYNGNRISRIDNKCMDESNMSSYTLFEYEGNQLVSAKGYRSTGENMFTYDFMYQGDKMSQFFQDNYHEGEIFYLTWEGDNLSEIYQSDKGGTTHIRFEYDNKINPLYGCLCYDPWILFVGGSYHAYSYGIGSREHYSPIPYTPFVSKNNCTVYKNKKDKPYYNIGYTYNEDGYPIKQTVTSNNSFRLFQFEYE